ncbi:MAG: hypothetical protein LBR38_09545 [Synergistaceae bacterium]|jgi:hypothetical protein|nr:hypothetical protein [Synergistaceae bacterium]
MKRSKISRVLCAAVVCSFIYALAPAEGALKRGKLTPTPQAPAFQPEPLSKKGTIAVLVKGPDPQHDAATAAIVLQRLTAKGYKVVDQKKLAAIRESKAALLALEGDIDGIMKLSSQYSVGTVITLNAAAGYSRRNEFDMFTGTASVAVRAVTSGGKEVYADTVQGKAVGYSRDEADQKAIEAAAALAADRMTQ